MLINRNNYETYFLDFLEGRLNSEEEAGLMAFLEQNPDLKKELDGFENIRLFSDNETFSNKEQLRRNINKHSEISDTNFEQFCIAKLEGDLDVIMSRKFDKYLSEHPEKLKDYKILLKTFLEPDKSIFFPEKQKLRHRQIKPNKNRLLISVSVAASIALIVVSYQFYNTYRLQDKKIYTAIHEKLKIDSLLTANILGPEKQPEEKKVPVEKHYIAENKKADSIIKHVPLRPGKPIEIVQLDAGVNNNEFPLAINRSFSPLSPLLAVENRKSYLTVKEYATQELKKRLDISDVNLNDETGFWQAAKTGVKQINKITGMNISLDKQYDSLSNRTKVIIHSNLLSFYSSTKK